jgi:hypothetical protein
MRSADGYIRVSRVGGRKGESFISPDEQRAAIEAWAKATETEILEWHTDLDQSESRPGTPGRRPTHARFLGRGWDRAPGRALKGGEAAAWFERPRGAHHARHGRAAPLSGEGPAR